MNLSYYLQRFSQCRYINDLVYQTGNPDIYGFLKPQSLQRSGNKSIDTQTFIQNWIKESRKSVYFALIIHK